MTGVTHRTNPQSMLIASNHNPDHVCKGPVLSVGTPVLSGLEGTPLYREVLLSHKPK